MDKQVSIIHIGLVGGGEFCAELLKKTTSVFEQEEIHAPFIAVTDPDPASPGMALAEQLGLLTFTDYHELYDPRYSIHLKPALSASASCPTTFFKSSGRRSATKNASCASAPKKWKPF